MADGTTELPVVNFADFDPSVIHAKAPRGPVPHRAPKSKRPASHLTSSSEPPIPPTSPEEPTSHPGASSPAPHSRERTARQLYQERLESDPSYVPTVSEFWGHDDRLLDKDLHTLSPWWRGRWQGGPRGRGFGSRRRDQGRDRGDTNAGNDSHSTSEVAPSPQRDVRFSPRPGTACSTDSLASTTPGTWNPTSHPETKSASPPAPHHRGRTGRQLHQEQLENDPSYVPTVGEFWGRDDQLLDKDLRTLSPWWRGRWQGDTGRGFRDRRDTNVRNGSHSTGGVPPSMQGNVQLSPRPGTACSTDSLTSTTPRTWYLIKPERPWTKHHELFLYSDPSLRPRPGQGPTYRVKLSGTHPEVIVQTPIQPSPHALTPPRELVSTVPLPRCERKHEATETEHIMHPNPDPNAVKPSERTTQLARKSSVGPPTQEQLQHPTSSSSDVYAAHGASPFQNSTLRELGRPAILQAAREQIPSLNGPSRCVPEGEDDLPEYRAKSAVPNNSFAAATLAALTERDRHVAQLTDELRELADQLFVQTSLVEQKDAELVDMQATLDELLLSRDQHVRALEQADDQIGKYETELAEARADLGVKESELEQVRLRLMEREVGWAKGKQRQANCMRRLRQVSSLRTRARDCGTDPS